MAAADGNGHDDAGRKVWDPFAWSPPSTEARSGQSIDVPRTFCEAVDARLAVTGDDALLPRVCELLGAHDHLRIADKVRAMAAHHFAADHLHNRSTTLPVRRRRIARVLDATAAAYDAWLEVEPALVDDHEFVHSEVGRTALAFFLAAGKAHLLLSEERARYRAEEEAKGLKISGRGSHVRAAVSPTQEFLLLAEILWMQETRAPARKYSSDYLQYLQLVWELITGEPERSFAKAIRSYDKVMEKLRTRHKR